jgi:mono/diheme cytochrome c family protein
MTTTNETISDPPKTQRVSRPVMIGSIIAVFAANIAVLAYATYMNVPSVAQIGPAEAAGSQSARGSSIAPMALVSRSSGSSANEDATQSSGDDAGEYAGDDEDADWTFEPIRVVNELDIPSLDEIKPAYVNHCATCHGVDGRGNGPAADQLLPMPRDFVGSVFRYATTGSDREHITSDLERTITNGVPRSAMPGFGGVLPERQIAGLARYVLDLRENGDDQPAPADYIDLGVRPPNTPDLVARGKELYTALACVSCHGEAGRGDGPNAMGLVDFQGKPIRPADFTTGLFKSGQTPEDLCRTVLRGIPGTPMVAYEMMLAQDNDDDSVNTLDAWALVSYVRSFAPGPPPVGVASGAEIPAVKALDEAMLTDPSHIAWLGIEPTVIQLKPLQQRFEKTTSAAVRVVRTDDQIAICLEWRDDTPDLVARDDRYPDAASIAIGLTSEVPVLPIDLERAAERDDENLKVWHWQADRQFAQTAGVNLSSVSITNSPDDQWYLFVPGNNARIPGIKAPVSAGNTTSKGGGQTDGTGANVQAVIDSTAHGPTSLSSEGEPGMSGTAAWANGVWRVIIVRPLASLNDRSASPESTARAPFAVSIWNGSKGDHDGVKLVSSWHWIHVRPQALQ